MQQRFTAAFRNILSAKFRIYREQNQLSQEAMAGRLHISARSYSDLEHGKTLCSSPVLLLFLSSLDSNEVHILMCDVKETVDSISKGAA